MLCKICQKATIPVGSKRGRVRRESFEILQCSSCGFAFVSNPWLDFPAIYSEDYYRGLGADPTVDYVFELDFPDQTIRQYEWCGILETVQSYVPLRPETKWLDFGCGGGGLVRYVGEKAGCRVDGMEEGWIQGRARQSGIHLLSEEALLSAQSSFDVVTAIEVLEHLPDPLKTLRQIRSLLKPGGLFFFTTGNLAPFRNKLLDWSYLRPEVHIGFFEPRTLELALRTAGFRTEPQRFSPAFKQIIRFKVLKGLGIRRTSGWERLLPWESIARLVDRRYRVTNQPVAWAD